MVSTKDGESRWVHFRISEQFCEPATAEQGPDVEAMAQRCSALLKEGADSLSRIRRLLPNMLAVHTLQSLICQMQAHQFEPTMEWVIRNDTNSAAIATGYGRLFNRSTGSTRFNADELPDDLLPIHEELIAFRDERYAHHGGHSSLLQVIDIAFDGETILVHPSTEMGFYVNGSSAWKMLFDWWAEYIEKRLEKELRHVTKKTGVAWRMAERGEYSFPLFAGQPDVE